MEFQIRNYFKKTRRKTVDLKPNDITIVVGRNGYGKTSFLRGIQETFKNDPNTIVIYWSDNEYGRGEGLSKLSWAEDLEGMASMMFCSEGQKMMGSVSRFFIQRIGRAARLAKSEHTAVFILADQLDSGLDVCLINDIKRVIREVAIPDMNKKGLTVYCVLSANSYEMVAGEDCLNPVSRKHVRFNTLDEYATYIYKQYGKKWR